MFYMLKKMYMTRIAMAANLPYPAPKRFEIYDCCGYASYHLMLARKNGKYYTYLMDLLRRRLKMINKDAIEILKSIQDSLEETKFLERCAIDMAINALEENESLAKSVIEAGELIRKKRLPNVDDRPIGGFHDD